MRVVIDITTWRFCFFPFIVFCLYCFIFILSLFIVFYITRQTWVLTNPIKFCAKTVSLLWKKSLQCWLRYNKTYFFFCILFAYCLHGRKRTRFSENDLQFDIMPVSPFFKYCCHFHGECINTNFSLWIDERFWSISIQFDVSHEHAFRQLFNASAIWFQTISQSTIYRIRTFNQNFSFSFFLSTFNTFPQKFSFNHFAIHLLLHFFSSVTCAVQRQCDQRN